jgi:hypothetical protein
MSMQTEELYKDDLDQLLHDIRQRVQTRLGLQPAPNGSDKAEADSKVSGWNWSAAVSTVEAETVLLDVPSAPREERPDRVLLGQCANAVRDDIECTRALGAKLGELPPSPPTFRRTA